MAENTPTFSTPAQAVEFLLSKHIDDDLEAIYAEVRRGVCSPIGPNEQPGANIPSLVAQCRERNKTAVRAAALLMTLIMNATPQPTDASGMPLGAGPPKPVGNGDELAIRRGARKEP